jgi:hypothetical protein
VYVLQTVMPEHWIPLIPRTRPANYVPTRPIVLQRGSLQTQDVAMRPITAQDVLLEPAISPWFFHEEEVPGGGC